MHKYLKELYSIENIMKAAYAFTDSMYIHLDADEHNYLISLCTKSMEESKELYVKFENELIAQKARQIVAEKTKYIREMIVSRALASTLITKNINDNIKETDFNANDILKDWFEENE